MVSVRRELTPYFLNPLTPYLVHSLRNWLTRKQKETRRGRAELKLFDTSASWNAKPENRFLPSWWENLNIRLLTDNKKWTEPQRKMMGKAGRVHGIRFVLSLVASVVVFLGVINIRNAAGERQRNAEATRLVKGLLTADTSQIKTVIEKELPGFRQYATDDLQQAFQESPAKSHAKRHAALAFLPDGKSVLPFLKNRLLTITPLNFVHMRDLLIDDKDELVASYWETARTGETPALRFQAACALAGFDAENEHWQEKDFQTFVAGHLVSVRPSELLLWTNALRPVKDHLTGALSTVYRNPDAGEQVRSFATDTLADFWSDNSDGLFDLLAVANEKQFASMFSRLDFHREEAVALGIAEVARTFLEDASEAEKESLAMRQANAAVMLLKMGASDQVWPLLKHSPDPRVRSYIIHWLSPRAGDPKTIIARYEQETDVTIKRALLLCLGEFELEEVEQQPLVENLLEVYSSDRDAGLHAAAEWLLRKWKQDEKISAIDKELPQTEKQLTAAKDKQRQWYVNGQGQTFVIFDAGEFQMGSRVTEADRRTDETLHRRWIGRKIAIASKEVTREQWRVFYNSTKVWPADQDQFQPYIRSDDSPMVMMTWYEAVHYCNWLSEQEGILEEQWCYEKNEANHYGPGMKAKDNFLELTGYRLPTEAEWEYACRAGASTSRYYGVTDILLPRYSWHLYNSNDQAHPVASLKPNDYGLFDAKGNVWEWCYDSSGRYPVSMEQAVDDLPPTGNVYDTDNVEDLGRRVLSGGAFFNLTSIIRSSGRFSLVPSTRFHNCGFRPARTWH